MTSLDRTATVRVRLTALDESDSPSLFRWMEDRDFRLLSGAFEFVSPQDHADWLTRARVGDREHLALAVRDLSQNRLLGLVQLVGIHGVHRHAELRIKLAPEETGRGYGTEAVKLLCAHGFRDLNLRRIFLHVFADNLRAIGSYLKAGFQHEGQLRKHAFVDGGYRDLLIMGILRGEET